MAQRSLLLKLTPPKKKSRLDNCEKSSMTTPLNPKDTVAAPPARRVSKRLSAQNDQSDESIIDNFFAQRKAKHCKQQSLVVSLNKVRMQRDRVIQELLNASNSKTLKAMLKRTNTRIKSIKKKVGGAKTITAKHVCILYPLYDLLRTHISMHIRQVYEVLEKNFMNCPWPIPPSSVLMYLSLEEVPGVQTREERLRSVIAHDMKWRHASNWEFRPVRPYPVAT